ncbi:MAG: DUF6452 family protein [Fulvivirga sp.]
MRHIIPIFLAVLLLYSCEEPDCVSETSSTIDLSFYQLDLNQPDTVFVNKISAIGSDSILVTNTANVSKVSLPANPQTGSATFVFDIREYGIDTLIVTYQNGARMIAEDCPFELIFSDLNYSRNDFDSIRIVNKVLLDAINEDIRVYNN